MILLLSLPLLSLADNPDAYRELTRIRRLGNTHVENMCITSISRTLNTTVDKIDDIRPFDISLIEKQLNLTAPSMMIQMIPIPTMSCIGRHRKVRHIVSTLNRLIDKLNLVIFNEIERFARLNAVYHKLTGGHLP